MEQNLGSNREKVTAFYAHLLTERRCSRNTYVSYKTDIAQFAKFLETIPIQLEMVTESEIVRFISSLYDQGMNARTVARKISAIKLLFYFCNRSYAISNVAAHIHFPKIEKKLPKYLSEQEIQSLLLHAGSDSSPVGVRNKVMIYLLYVSGMRISELIQLKRDDLFFDTQLVSIYGKGGKQRMVPIPESIMVIIKNYLDKEYLVITKNIETPYLFPVLYNSLLKPLSRQAFWILLKAVCIKAGIGRVVSPHQLRHSFATHMLKRGADLRSLQMLLGHETIATVQIYTHVETSHLRDIYDKKHPRS